MPAPTGYQLRYWTRYRIAPPPGETALGDKQRVYIYQRGYTGNPSQVEMDADYLLSGGIPVTLSAIPSKNDDPFAPVWGRKADFRIVTQSNFSLKDLYTDDAREYFVSVDHCTDEQANTWLNVFSGWLTPFDARESYASFPYPVNFSATCGIGALKDTPYRSYPDKKGMRGKETLMLALQTALAHVGYDISIYLYLPIAEIDQLTANNVPEDPWNPLDNKWFDQALFKNATCYDVIKAIAEAFGAQICQQDGAFRIRSVRAMCDITDPNGDDELIPWFNWGKTLSGVALVIDNSRPELVTRRVYKKNALIPLAGSTISIEPQYHRSEVAFTYGDPQNEIANGDFGAVNGSLPVGLTRFNLSPSEAYAVGDGTDDNPWGFRIDGVTDREQKRQDKQFVQFPELAYSERFYALNPPADEWSLSFEYVNINCRGAKLVVSVIADNKGYCFNEDGTWKKTGDKDFGYYYFHSNIYSSTNAAGAPVMKAKPTKGVKVDLQLPAIPGKAKYTFQIRLLKGHELDNQTGSPAPYIIYRNFVLTRTNKDERELKGERYVASIATDGPERKVDETALVIADQRNAKNSFQVVTPPNTITTQVYYRFRQGAIRRANQEDGTERWKIRPPAFGSLLVPLASQLAYDKLRIMGTHRRLFDGEVYCLERLRPFDIPQFLELLDPNGKPMRALILSLEETTKLRICRIKAVLIPSAVPQIRIKNYFETPDGVLIPMADEETASGGPRSGAVKRDDAVINQIKKSLKPTIAKAIAWNSANPILFTSGYTYQRVEGKLVKVPIQKPWAGMITGG